MSRPLRFALNRMVAPSLALPAFIQLTQGLGCDALELRNDLPGVELDDGTPATEVRALCQAAGLRILSINALYPFDVWNDERRAQALRLAAYARDCGAEGLVLCPLNDRGDPRDAAQRARDLRTALSELAPILRDHGVLGFVEPLGFPESALRLKRQAVEAIRAIGGLDVFRLVHDTFHHHLAGETEFFAELTGLVHVSGVAAGEVPVEQLRDAHRVLVEAADRLGNVAQLERLLDDGYRGALSFEPFAASVHGLPDVAPALARSMRLLQERLSCGAAPA
ncbi:TIM barrel protein [Pseudomonas oryzihabitans]|uniref:TIM barrel protein n=1 Tax=Pseudomonas oryzihabitans TaxID=47885 RepID=UPI0028939BB3|nr:TIM barrel protein [Pseudomonas oryzihabitans]MDT3719309.1 TIM barrel protein [Pseudomonas oryzihabitans]